MRAGRRLTTIVRGALLCAALTPLASETAHAGPWTRDAGHLYLNLSYSRIAAKRLFLPDGSIGDIAPYQQHAAQIYGEVGLIDRWLTASLEGQFLRYNQLTGQGATFGAGDLRIGFWTGLVTRPLRLTAAIFLGVPSGDPTPGAGATTDGLSDADPEQRLYRAYLQDVARTLPTGDGETDVELRLSLGYSFGRHRRWPLEHFLIVEAGYWVRTASFDHRGTLLDPDFHDAFTYKVELGTKFPWKFIDRFWFIFHLPGLASFALLADPASQGALGAATARPASSCTTGLGNGVSYFAYGFDVLGRIYKGLGANIGYDSAFAARCVAAAGQLKVGLSYEF